MTPACNVYTFHANCDLTHYNVCPQSQRISTDFGLGPAEKKEALVRVLKYRMAQEAHPLQRQFGVLRQSTALRQEQIDAARLPDLQWNGRARLQSDVVQFPLEFPGIAIPPFPLYSIQTTVDAAYVIADGGMAAARRAVELAALSAEEQAVSVELELFKPRINELFFGILLLHEREAVQKKTARAQSGWSKPDTSRACGALYLITKTQTCAYAIPINSFRRRCADTFLSF